MRRLSVAAAAVACIAPCWPCATAHAAPRTPATAHAGTRTPATAQATPRTPATIAHSGQSAGTEAEAPIPVAASQTPPAGRKLSADRVLEIAGALPKMRAVRAKYPGSYGGAYLKGPLRWQVSYFSRGGKKEIGQVIIADASARVLEQWTGFQVAWTMARGYPGAFGRHVNALYIWLPLCFLFFVPFVDFRHPFSLLHLDLLVLLSFSVSLAFFNHAHIYASVPLTYPPLAYLLVRALMLTAPGRRGKAVGGPAAPSGDHAAPSADRVALSDRVAPSGDHVVPSADRAVLPADRAALSGGLDGPQPGLAHAAPLGSLRMLVPTPWLALGLVFLIGFRIALNVIDSNVIDVGYAGVIGAQRIVSGRSLYGSFPADNEHGDTYGPVNYEAYVPFEQIFGWSGTWDDLPAAHAAAIVFDLLAIALLFLLGRRVRGPSFGVVLAYAWASYPFTLFTLESNSNDALVAVLVLAALLCASSAPARGALAALASLTKFAPLALVPVLATHRAWPPRAHARALTLFAIVFLATAAAVSVPALTHNSLPEIYERTIGYQSERGSPFSVWGLYGLHGLQTAVQIAVIALALGFAVVRRRVDLVGLAAACAALMIAAQLSIDHWFYLYIPWFFAPLMLALLGAHVTPKSPAGRTRAARSQAAGAQAVTP